ncbi:hypothetical protein LUZ60_002431 [Juncus effusus]|nr:hypothetical protein LUZ60_002431 [Juncus effusus]
MAGVGALVSSLLSSITKLLPEVKNSFFAPSSSSSAQSPDARAVKDDLEKLMRTLKWIKATLYDAEEREIRDRSVKLWLKELKEVAHAAGYVIDEYMYEVYRAKVEVINAYELNPHKRKQEGSVSAPCAHTVRVPDKLVHHIRGIRSRFDEIVNDREAFRLHEEDGPKRVEGEGFQAPSSYLETNVFGRNRDKEKVIDLLFSYMNKSIITVVPIVGKGGIGKTTLAQLVYNDEQVKQNFDLFGWIRVSKNFNIGRLMQELIESFTQKNCSLKNLSTIHVKFQKIVIEKKVFVVLDDVWNEDIDLWESLNVPFKSAVRVVFIVTTRNEQVANVMQTITSPFRPGCLSEEDSWSLFQHYSGMNRNVHTEKRDIGEKIAKKCGGLPLALKSISKILCYENEETWIEILENDLREISAENDIFKALQISYTYMPTYLRQCFLYCSLFPKDYEYEVDEMVELWIAQGYIECKGTKTLEEIAFDYIVELREMSFIDPIYKGTSWRFKIHDMVHDLARLNSGNEFYCIEIGKQPNPPDGILHLYVDDSNEPWDNLTFKNITRLVTLILKVEFGSNYIDLSKAKGLKVFKLQYTNFEKNGFLPNFVFPKHLRFLDLAYAIGGSLAIPLPLSSLYHLEKLNLNLSNSQVELEALGNLINLQSLNISHCTLSKLPETIGNLVRLEKLVIHGCEGLCFFPESLCELSGLKTLILTECPEFTMLPENIANLTNLQSLIIKNTGISYLPPGFNKLCVLSQLDFQISLSLGGVYDQISWFKDLDNLKGTVAIQLLRHMPSMEHACNFNLISKPYLEKLILSWGAIATGHWDKKRVLEITMGTDKNYMQKTRSARQLVGEDMDSRILENLQPHPNLKHIEIWNYNGCTFPKWMGGPSSCASLEELHLCDCLEITYLPFANIGSLKHLKLLSCYSIQRISRESLPSQLQSLIIFQCSSLLTITELADLEFLVELEIQHCERLASFPFELLSERRCLKSSSSGLQNLSPLKKMKIRYCPELQLVVNEVVPSVQCNIEISDCEGLKEWCLQHKISYKPE